MRKIYAAIALLLPILAMAGVSIRSITALHSHANGDPAPPEPHAAPSPAGDESPPTPKIVTPLDGGDPAPPSPR